MNNLDKQYISILNQILTEGYRKPNRTGVDNSSSLLRLEIEKIIDSRRRGVVPYSAEVDLP